MPGYITIIGNLGRDAEVRDVGGERVAKLSVACESGHGDRTHTTWWDIDAWGRQAEWVGQLPKGAAVTVVGEVQSREHDGRVFVSVRAQRVHAHDRTKRKPPVTPTSPDCQPPQRRSPAEEW